MKVVGVLLVALCVFLVGYYSALFVVDDKVDEIQAVSNIVVSSLNEAEKIRKVDRLLMSLTAESMLFTDLMVLDETGKPLHIAISDSAKRLNDLIHEASEIYGSIKSAEEKTLLESKVRDIKEKYGAAIFHFGK